MPDLDLALWKTSLRVWAGWQTFAVMLYPKDGARRQEFLAVRAAQWMQEHSHAPDTTALIATHCLEPAGGFRTVLNAPAISTVEERTGPAIHDGNMAGSILLLVFAMVRLSQQAGAPLRDQGSLKKAIYLLTHRKFPAKNAHGLRIAHYRKRLYDAWRQYKSVAHLWAAYRMLFPSATAATPEQALAAIQTFWDDELFFQLPTFLARAAVLCRFGETHSPYGQNTPLLAAAETWKVPKAFQLPPCDLEALPFPEDVQAVLNTYKAPRQA